RAPSRVGLACAPGEVRGDLRAPKRLFEVNRVLRSAKEDGDLVESRAACRFGEDEPRDLDALAALARGREDLDLLTVGDRERRGDALSRAGEEPRLQTRQRRGRARGFPLSRAVLDGGGGQRALGKRERTAVA